MFQELPHMYVPPHELKQAIEKGGKERSGAGALPNGALERYVSLQRCAYCRYTPISLKWTLV